MPGYTHLQRAMPSSWGFGFLHMRNPFIDNVDLINNTIDWVDSNPLGSAAGYGVAIPLNRDLVTKELGFNRTQLIVCMSRIVEVSMKCRYSIP